MRGASTLRLPPTAAESPDRGTAGRPPSPSGWPSTRGRLDPRTATVYGRGGMKVPREPGREVEREAAPPAAPRHAAADRVLALQSTAGNRAVAAMLAREPDAPVQADAKGAPKDKPPAPPSGPHVVLGGIGAIALEGFSMAGRQTPGGGGRGQGRERDRPPPQEFQLTTRSGSHSSDLMRAATNGKGMDGEIVLKGGVKIVLKGAMITSYQVSGSDKEQIEAWTLNVESAEFVIPKEAEGDEKSRENPGYDLAPGKGS